MGADAVKMRVRRLHLELCASLFALALCVVAVSLPIGVSSLKGDYFNGISSHPPNTIRVEGTMAMSPVDSTYEGIDAARAYTFWAERLNRMGGITVNGTPMNVSVVIRDDAFDGAFIAATYAGYCARSNATRPHYLLLPYDAISGVAAMQARCPIPSFSIGFMPETVLMSSAAASFPLYHMGAPRERGFVLLNSFFDSLIRAPRLALVLKEDDPFSTILANTTIAFINGSQTQLVGVRSYADSSTKLSHFLKLLDLVSSLKTLDPDIVVYYGLFSDMVTVMEAAKLTNFKPKTIITTVLYPTKDIVNVGENWMVMSAYNPLANYGTSGVGLGTTAEQCAAFLAAYPVSYDCQTLSAVMTATEAFRAAVLAADSLAPAAIHQSMHTINLTTSAGPFVLNAIGQNLGRSFRISQLRNGSLVPIKSENPADPTVAAVFPLPREPDVPGVPKSTVLSNGIMLSYGVANKGSANDTKYEVQATNDRIATFTTVYNGTASAVLLTNLIGGVTYRFRVRAYSSAGSSEYSAEVTTAYAAGSSTKDLTVKIAVPIGVVAGFFIVVAAVSVAYARRIAHTKVNATLSTLDLDGPVAKAMKVIEGIRQNRLKGGAMLTELKIVEEALIANNMYQPVLDASSANNNIGLETVQFLDNLLLTRLMPEKRAKHGNLSRRPSTLRDQSFGSMTASGNESFAGRGLNGRTDNVHEAKEVTVALDNIHRWDFNIFTLEAATMGHPLCALAFEVMWKLGLIEAFAIDDGQLKRFLLAMESGYMNHDAVYHTSTHAADVLHAMFVFFQQERFRNLFTPREMLAACLACVGHDLDHPGVTNSFLIGTGHDLALLYNDTSVLENHHSASFFKVLQDPDANILRNLDAIDLKAVRKLVCTLILATDVAQHFEHLAKFKTRVSSGLLSLDADADRTLVLVMAIKCADVSNPTKPKSLYDPWTARIMEEFYRQGDRERDMGMPVSMFMDRQNKNIGKCQNGFIEVIVSPLFKSFTEFLGFEEPQNNVERNHQFWKRQLELQAGSEIDFRRPLASGGPKLSDGIGHKLSNGSSNA